MYRRKLLLWFLCLIVVPFLVLIAVLGLLIGRSLAARPLAVDRLARYMPSDTAVFFSICPHPGGEGAETWERVRAALLSIPELREGQEKAFAQIKQQLYIDWPADLESWLGDSVAVGLTDLSPLLEMLPRQATDLLPPEEKPPAMPQLPILLAVEVRDAQAFDSFLGRLKSDLATAGRAVEEMPHREATISTIQTEGVEIFLALREGQVLLVSNDRAAVEAALVRGEGDSLAAASDFRAVVDRLPAGGLALGYASYGALTETLLDSMAELSEVPLPEGWPTGGGSAGFTLLAEPEGLRLVAASRVDLDALTEAGLAGYYRDMRAPNPGRALQFLPKESALVVSGQGLRSVWKMQMAQLEQMSAGEYSTLQKALESLTADVGLDLEEDFLSWMGGEYALFVALPGTLGRGTALGLPFRVGLVLEVQDQEKARQSMQRLEELLSREEEIVFRDVEIEGIQTRSTQAAELAGGGPGYAFVDDFLVAGLDSGALQAAFQARGDGGKRLAASPVFDAVARALPEARTSLYFMDLGSLARFVGLFLSGTEQGDAVRQIQPLLDLVGGLGMAVEAGRAEDDVTLTTLFLQVNP